jgi:hypothetical protein
MTNIRKLVYVYGNFCPVSKIFHDFAGCKCLKKAKDGYGRMKGKSL